MEVGVLANKSEKAKASTVGERAVQGLGTQSTGLPRGPAAQSPQSPFPGLALVTSLPSRALHIHAAG